MDRKEEREEKKGAKGDEKWRKVKRRAKGGEEERYEEG